MIPNGLRVCRTRARPPVRFRRPRALGSLALGWPKPALVVWGPCRASRTKLSCFGFNGTKHRPLADIGWKFGVDAREVGREPTQRRFGSDESSQSSRDAYDPLPRDRILRSGGDACTSIVDASDSNKTSYGTRLGSGGNCERVRDSESHVAASPLCRSWMPVFALMWGGLPSRTGVVLSSESAWAYDREAGFWGVFSHPGTREFD